MRKEISKVLRKKFNDRMKEQHSDFKRFKEGVTGGDRCYAKRFSDQITCFISLSISDHDVFYIELGWSCDHKLHYDGLYPELDADYAWFGLGEVCPLDIKIQSEFRLDHSPLIGPDWWDVLGLSEQEFMRRSDAGLITEEEILRCMDAQDDPVEVCIARIDGYLDQGFQWLKEYGIPFLEKVTKEKEK